MTKKEKNIACAVFVFVFLIGCSLFIGIKFPQIDYDLALKTFHPSNLEYYQKDEVCQYEGCEEKADKKFYNLIFLYQKDFYNAEFRIVKRASFIWLRI